ncbi:MAG TPA: 30S ribosomal protein S9 [Spirochaetota bacterium]|jgi:small subunit ribosomal protein S9|nr:30S ribosomal protein S9 [Spirochaetota bacterium]HOA08494.1 30S ribosomal protein S9 [Spirochaetota bacterium]HOF33849.1 30S ribosomal protein S9 [Spirochaetota bacterium]HOH37288.1 30S ribosomal protein S9 [Spirochaetota bacterium]HOR43852.1 30S ribosomal protein S9 [Spirochaetota bacterium]
MAAAKLYATGRRKSSIAKVYLKPGSGNIMVNKKPLNEYFRRQTLELVIKQPLGAVDKLAGFDIDAYVTGGGWSGQAGAMRLGISRCLVLFDERMKKTLRESGFLTRDARKVERKKYGHKKARKSFQFSKR